MKNPLTRFRSKLAIQKYASEKANHSAEKSPVRSPQRARNTSPNRKSIDFSPAENPDGTTRNRLSGQKPSNQPNFSTRDKVKKDAL